jgi:hypothetical protein
MVSDDYIIRKEDELETSLRHLKELFLRGRFLSRDVHTRVGFLGSFERTAYREQFEKRARELKSSKYDIPREFEISTDEFGFATSGNAFSLALLNSILERQIVPHHLASRRELEAICKSYGNDRDYGLNFGNWLIFAGLVLFNESEPNSSYAKSLLEQVKRHEPDINLAKGPVFFDLSDLEIIKQNNNGSCLELRLKENPTLYQDLSLAWLGAIIGTNIPHEVSCDGSWGEGYLIGEDHELLNTGLRIAYFQRGGIILRAHPIADHFSTYASRIVLVGGKSR